MSHNTPLYGQYTNIGQGTRRSTGGHCDSGCPGSLGGHDGGGNGLSGGGGGNPYTTPYIGGNEHQGPNDRAPFNGGGGGGSGPPNLATFSNPRGTKVFSCKPDATVFPTLKSNAQFQLWYIEVMCFLQNHTAYESLNGRTPIEWLLGFTPDITVLLQFIFYELVYYAKYNESFPGDTTELLG